MAGSSSSVPGVASMLTRPVSEKLSKQNQATWKAQVVATMHGARLEGYLTSKIIKPTVELDAKDGEKEIKITNPDYEDWLAADQQVLSFLLTSVSKDVLIQIAAKKTAVDAWQTTEAMFSSQTRAHMVNTRLALTSTFKGSMTVAEYIGRMKTLGDEMAVVGRKLEDDELVEYILTGLDEEYDSLASNVLSCTDPISVSELYSLMLAFEIRVDLHTKGNSSRSSTNTTSHGCGHGGGPGRSSQGNRGGRGPSSPAQRGDNGGFHLGGLNGGSRNNNSGTSSERPLC
jgi:hypothetical protein